MSQRGRGAGSTCVLLAIGLVLPARPAAAQDWEWSVVPYLWASDIGLDLTANNEPVIGTDVTFEELLDKTEIAGMVHFEGRRNKAGFFVDALYLSLNSDRSLAGYSIVPDGTLVDSDLETGIYEAGGFYRVIGEGRVLDVLAGARLIDMDQEHVIARPSMLTTTIATSDSLLDAFVGLRYAQPLGDRWDVSIRGDVGAGDTDLTWNALGTFGVRCGKTGRYVLRFGWRHMQVEVESTGANGIEVETDLTFSGPLVGFAFRL